VEINPLDPAYGPLAGLHKHLSWWLASAILIGYVVFLFLLKELVFRLLKRWADRSEKHWIDLVLRTLSLPITFFILSGMITFIPLIFRVSKSWKNFYNYTAQFLTVLAFAVFFQKLLLALYRRYVTRQAPLIQEPPIIRVLIVVIVYSFFGIIFLDAVGVSITPLIASLGVGSVAIAFALQETLASLFAGLYLVTDKPIRVGDFVRLETGQEGYVETIGWRSTRIRMLPNNIVIVPNSKLTGGTVTNYSLPEKELAVIVEVGVDYGSDLEKVEKVTLEVAREVMAKVPGGVPSFDPAVRFDRFGDSSINFVAILRARDFTDQPLVRHEFIKRIHKRYEKEGIAIPFPIRTVHLKQK
jgi:small-conductance mechanosensitive channel